MTRPKFRYQLGIKNGVRPAICDSKYNYDLGVVTRQDPLGAAVTTQYDAAGRVKQVTNAVNGAYTRWVYPVSQTIVNQFTTIQEGQGEAYSATIFDGAGRARATASDFPDNTPHYSGQYTAYDVTGRAVSRSNPIEINSNWTATGADATAQGGFGWVFITQTYDWKGRPLRTTNSDGTYKEASYGGCGCAGGEVVTLKDEGTLIDGVLKRRTQRIYTDPLGRSAKSEVLNWDGSVYSTTANTYNARDQVTLVRQFQGPDTSGVYQDTTLTFDGHGRLQTKHVPEQNAGTATIYSYNNDDTINSVTDARGASTTYGYNNNRHLVTGITYSAPSGSGITVPAAASFGYDAVGNRTSMSDGSGSVTYHYDQLSRMDWETRVINGLSGAYTIGYSYNLSGELKSLTDPQGRTVNYDYNSGGRLASVTGTGYNTSTFISNYQYRAWGAPKHFNTPAMEYNTTSSVDLSYNSRLQLTHFEWVQPTASGGSVDAYKSNYQYYADGRIKFISDVRAQHITGFPNDPPQEIWHNFDRSYGYDHAARLTQALTGDEARGGSTADGPYKENYQYDVWEHMNARTNRIWSKPPDSFTANYINNRNHDPLSLWQYDADGNPTFDDNGSSSYDASGRKLSYGSSRFFNPTGSFNPNSRWYSSVATNTYDGDGQLTKQLETVGTDHWDTYFVRSSVLGGAIIFWKEVQTNSYYAPGWSNTIQLASIYAQGDRIAQSNNGAVTFEYEEPFTGRRRGVEPDPLGQEVGSYDPGPDEPGDVGGYPEQHEFGNGEDPSMGCTLDGITIDCGTRARFMNMGALATHWNEVNANGTIQPRTAPITPLGLGIFKIWLPDNARGNDRQYNAFIGVFRVPQDSVSRQPIHWYDLAKIRFDLKTKIASRGRCQEFLTKLLERAGETGGDKPQFTNIVDLFDAVLLQGGFVTQKETASGRGFSSVDGAVGAPGGAQVRLSVGSDDFKNNPALRIRYYAYDALSELTHVAGSKPSSYAEGAFSDYHLGITARDIANEMGTGINNLNLTLPTADPNNDPSGRWSGFYHDIVKIFCKRDF